MSEVRYLKLRADKNPIPLKTSKYSHFGVLKLIVRINVGQDFYLLSNFALATPHRMETSELRQLVRKLKSSIEKLKRPCSFVFLWGRGPRDVSCRFKYT